MERHALPALALPADPQGHFKLYYLATVFHVVEQAALTLGSLEALLAQQPFLQGYLDEVAAPELGPALVWSDALDALEARASGHLPLRALRTSLALDHRGLMLLLAVGLMEEDARFGGLFEAMQAATGAQRRPTLGLLLAWWRGATDVESARRALTSLLELRLLQVVNPEAPRLEWALQAAPLTWDALRGNLAERPAPWLRYRAHATLGRPQELVAGPELRLAFERMVGLLQEQRMQGLIVRGARHNGRHTLLAALAQTLGRGVLEVAVSARPEEERWRLLGPLATLLRAMPVIDVEVAAGETAQLPALDGYAGPRALVLGKQGGVDGPGTEGTLTLTVAMPQVEERQAHWRAGLQGRRCTALDACAERYRMTSGNIRRAAARARTLSQLRGDDDVSLDDAREASRSLGREALDTLATRLVCTGTLADLAVSDETRHELVGLRERCRERERLAAFVNERLRRQLNPGVRALLQGGSGTGKTLAAKLLAAELGLDLYRVDLSSVVSKYIGETQKHLHQIFTLAEELDIALLLDEGDSMLGQRTGVQSSNDRYANLETNYLLQRIETFEGILLVTTNASELIDAAFHRRMDVVVEFRFPEPSERLKLWHLHLPQQHQVGDELLHTLAARCSLSGGQIRNAVLHASLLALGEQAQLGSSHLEASVEREYRKMGGVFPLQRSALAPEQRN